MRSSKREFGVAGRVGSMSVAAWLEWLKYGPIERITGSAASAAASFGRMTSACSVIVGSLVGM